MSVLRFDPFRDVDRLAEQLLGTAAGTRRTPHFMPMDLFRSGDHFVVLADLPGVDPGSVDVTIDNGMLTIRAERTSRGEESVEWLASERFTGSYMRQLSLGDGIDAERIAASYDNGVLSVTIPLAEKAKTRRIDVTTTGSPQVIHGSHHEEIAAN
ncbi:MAG: Hsp20/alpha crystallin family protein [Candidatus Nanopelagicales bacterium]|nr:Hsp20/alpha crystallin family protein [Candidatus Nanopelagicales bacterium]